MDFILFVIHFSEFHLNFPDRSQKFIKISVQKLNKTKFVCYPKLRLICL